MRVKSVSFERIEKFYNEIKEGKKYRRHIKNEIQLPNSVFLEAIVFETYSEWYVEIHINFAERSGSVREYKLSKVFIAE